MNTLIQMTRVRINIHKMLNTNRGERYQKLQVDYKAGMFPLEHLWSVADVRGSVFKYCPTQTFNG